MLFRALLGLLGDVVGNGDAQLGRRVGVDIQAIVFLCQRQHIAPDNLIQWNNDKEAVPAAE